MEELIQEYKNQDPLLKITPVFGSSGSFVSQIEQGARFDLFFSADSFYPKKLSQSPRVGGETFEYAVGHLVLWIPSDSELSIESGLSLLTSPNVKKVALANPAHAPYGKAAEAALKNAKIYDLVSKKLVLGENVSQATQFVQTHAADVGIIAQSLALSPTLKNKGRFLPVPQILYPKIVQSGIILKSSPHPKEAQSFQNWILGNQGQKIFARWGFSPK
jgi:molybdate transport system substrate-binding protein